MKMIARYIARKIDKYTGLGTWNFKRTIQLRQCKERREEWGAGGGEKEKLKKKPV